MHACRWQAVYRVIPDERPLIEATLRELCDVEGCSLVVTTGGTGPAPRDVTPEATEAVGGGAGCWCWCWCWVGRRWQFVFAGGLLHTRISGTCRCAIA